MVLHFYQPPTQNLGITQQILDSCYLPLLRLLSQKSNFCLTINLNGSLLSQLQQLQATEFFDLIKELLVSNKIEILNSAIYHPIIPLTPADVVTRQITNNQNLLHNIFGIKPPQGFFPSELAIDTSSLNIINNSYIIVDQSSVNTVNPIVKYNQKYLLVNNHPVSELLRAYPKELLLPVVVDLVDKNCEDSGLLITANDAELFGHHYSERLRILTDLLDSKNIKFISASQAISQFGEKSISVDNIIPSTWQNCQEFSLWNKGYLQKSYLKLLNTGYELIKDNADNQALDYLDRSFSSCYPYWLSNWPWWHPDLVQSGAISLITSVRMSKISNLQKANFEIAYHEFLSLMWQFHWSGQVEINYQKYNQIDNKYLGI
jgi:alpha-amylase/alpha-mannosidase (GH57 family)